MADIEPIKVLLEVIQVKTMADGSPRFVFAASEDRTDLLQIFADVKRDGCLLETVMLAVVPEEAHGNNRKIKY